MLTGTYDRDMPSARDALATLAVGRLAGLDVVSGDLVAAAADAVAEGLEPPSMTLLAGLTGRDTVPVAEAFGQVIAELGIELPSDATAARWQLLSECLGEMVRGDVPLRAASARFRTLDRLLGRPSALGDLRRWLAMHAEWIPSDRTPIGFCEDQVLEQARTLLAGPWPPAAG